MPLMHAESLSYQDLALRSFNKLANDENSQEHESLFGFACSSRRHRAVIEKFGRFPHRNALLGRASRVEEEEFLRQPGSRF